MFSLSNIKFIQVPYTPKKPNTLETGVKCGALSKAQLIPHQGTQSPATFFLNLKNARLNFSSCIVRVNWELLHSHPCP